jgi:hypothetical protein
MFDLCETVMSIALEEHMKIRPPCLSCPNRTEKYPYRGIGSLNRVSYI